MLILLYTFSCFDPRLESEAFTTPYLRPLNIVGEWLSLRKCLNRALYFSRFVMNNTPAAVATLLLVNGLDSSCQSSSHRLKKQMHLM